MRAMKTALITHADCLGHVTPDGHPERVARLQHILHALDPLDLNRVTAPMAAEDDILRIHPADYLHDIRAARPSDGFRQIDGDTYMSPGSVDAAFRAAGAVVRAVDMVLGGEAPNAFCAIRPPGHHAETSTAMGFCLFGNAALAAKHALDHHGLSRVAVVDFDVHHGNGTQDLLWDEPRTLFCSSHQMPLYPGTGAKNETGEGNITNAPLARNDGSDHFKEAFKTRILPALSEANADLIIISAGFDAHHRDPLAEINLVADDFDWATGKIMEIASASANNRLVSILEGGYDLLGLAESAGAHIYRMMKG